MRVILDVLQGPRKSRSFTFERPDSFIVGRSRFVHCPMPEDSALSPRSENFLIEISPPRCEIRDLGSTNGTFVNDQRVERVRLNSGDRITAGQSIFQVRVEEESSRDVQLRAEGERQTETIRLGPNGVVIRCAGCGAIAPEHIDVVTGPDHARDEPVEWLCSRCRCVDSALPQPVPTYTTIRELGREEPDGCGLPERSTA